MWKNLLAVGLLLLFAAIVFRVLLVAPVVTSGDWWFQFAPTLNDWFSLPMSWVSQGAFGGVNISSLSMWPFFYLHGIFGHLGFDSGMSNKFVIFIPALSIFVLGSYLLIKQVTGSVVGAAVGSLVLLYNSYILLLAVGGNWAILTAYSFSLFSFWLYIRAVENKSIPVAVFSGLVCFVASVYELRAFYMLAAIMALYLIVNLLVVEKRSQAAGLIRYFFVGFLPIVITFALGSYWLFGLVQAKVLTSNEVFDRSIFGNGYMNLPRALALFHPFWSGTFSQAFKIYPIPWQFFLVPLFSFLGFYLNRANKKLIFWALLALIGILLAKQEAEPFGQIYKWLFYTVPGFKAFREASKFYFISSISFGVLIGAFIGWIGERKSFIKYLLPVAIAFIFVWNAKPVFTGEMKGLTSPRKIPSDYVIVKDYLQKQKDFSRVLWVPTASRWSLNTNNHPKVVFSQVIQTNWADVAKYGEFTNDIPVEKQTTYILKQPEIQRFLDLGSIRYVIVPLQDVANDDDFFAIFGPKQYYLDSLSELNFLTKLDIGTKEVVVYENKTYRPHVYLTDVPESLSEEISFNTVSFKTIDATKYAISLKNVTSPVYLNFSEYFNSEWALKINGSNVDLPQKDHQKSVVGLNSFYLDPFYFKGRTNVELILYFRPQIWVTYGLIVGGSVLAILVLYLIFSYVFSKK